MAAVGGHRTPCLPHPTPSYIHSAFLFLRQGPPVQPVISIQQLSKTYASGHPALQQIDLDIRQGEIFALLGPNGAGKSTLIALLTRLYDLQQGDIRIFGHSLRDEPRQALRQLGVVFQQSTLDLDLSVQQNLAYHAALHGMPRREAQARIDEELLRQDLAERRHDKVRTLNGGHRRRVEIARALLHQPRLLLLDEASAGLDPASRLALGRHVRNLCREQDLCVLQASENAERWLGSAAPELLGRTFADLISDSFDLRAQMQYLPVDEVFPFHIGDVELRQPSPDCMDVRLPRPLPSRLPATSASPMSSGWIAGP